VVGVAVTTGSPATESVTLTVVAVPPVGVRVNVPAYGVVDAVSPLGFTDTVIVYGVVAEATPPLSQVAELLMVNAIGDVPLVVLATDTVCVAGVLPPIV